MFVEIVRLERFSKREGDTNAFAEIDLTINSGTVTSIQAPYETGRKIIDLLMGKGTHSSGAFFVKGQPMTKSRLTEMALFRQEHVGYERLTIKEYLLFWKRLLPSSISIDSVLNELALIEKQGHVIKKLTTSEKKRVQFARCLMQDVDFYLFEYPDLQIDLETTFLFRQILARLKEENKAVLIFSSSLEESLLTSSSVYKLSETEFKEMESDDGESDKRQIQVPNRLEKIPAKMADKLILFDPTEIHYIESKDGVSHLHVNKESFECTLTLAQLEKRLTPVGFYRCHRSYIVNLQRVREIITWTRDSYSLVLDDQKKSNVPLSKGKYGQLKETLGV